MCVCLHMCGCTVLCYEWLICLKSPFFSREKNLYTLWQAAKSGIDVAILEKYAAAAFLMKLQSISSTAVTCHSARKQPMLRFPWPAVKIIFVMSLFANILKSSHIYSLGGFSVCSAKVSCCSLSLWQPSALCYDLSHKVKCLRGVSLMHPVAFAEIIFVFGNLCFCAQKLCKKCLPMVLS